MTAKASQRVDRRVQRTRRTLREALIALLMERGWDDVSVQDVCQRADVGRSTFYLHFADKEDLLVGGFDDLRAQLRAQLDARPPGPAPFRFVRGLIEHTHEHQRLFRALVGKRSGQVVLRRFFGLLLELVREDVLATREPGPTTEATVHLVAGGLMQLLSWWLDTRNPLEVADVERLFVTAASQAIGLLPRRRR